MRRTESNQKEVTNMTLAHRGSVGLHAALHQERVTTKSLLQSVGKQVLGQTKTTAAITAKIERRDMIESIEGQVRGLGNYKVPEASERIENLLQRQKESRRKTHLLLLKEYETWIQSLYDQLESQTQEENSKWWAFSAASLKELDSVIDNLRNEVLLGKEYEWIAAAFANLARHIDKRKQEAEKLRQNLTGIERRRQESVESFLNILGAKLVDAAFLLKPEVDLLISEKHNELILHIAGNTEELKGTVEQVFMNEEEIQMNYLVKIRDRDQAWRRTHHEHYVKEFRKTIEGDRFVHPEERVNMLQQLKTLQEEIFSKRMDILNTANDIHSKILTSEAIQTLLDRLGETNENAQEEYDDAISKLVNLQKKIDSESDQFFEDLKSRLEYYHADVPYQNKTLLLLELSEKVENLKADGAKLLSKTIKYLEETDIRSQEVATKLLNHIKSLGEESDKHKLARSKQEKNYELEHAKKEDELDEAVSDLEEAFASKVEELRRAVTQDELNQKLKECFGILDDISQEHRNYSNNAIKLVSSHKDFITQSYRAYIEAAAYLFGLIPEFKKEEIIALYRAAKIKEIEAERQKLIEEGKRKLNKKEEEIDVLIPEYKMVNAAGGLWIQDRELNSIIDLILYTDEDREKEQERRKAQEIKKLEEEKKAQEEAQRKLEEARKKKIGGKGDEKVIEEVKEEVKSEEEEDTLPKDARGAMVLSTDVFIKYDFVENILISFRDRIMIDVEVELKKLLDITTENDKKVIEKFQYDLDEKLRYLWPRKGKLEVTFFTTRTTEIKKHHFKADRHLKLIQDKFHSIKQESETLIYDLDSHTNSYKTEMDGIKSTLASGNNLAVLQGLLRKARDLNLSLCQESRETFDRLEVLLGVEISSIFRSNETFLRSLPLIESGGDYSEQEIDYYHEKLKSFNASASEFQTNKSEDIKKFMSTFNPRRDDPLKLIEKDYEIAIENLSAREGLGKKYGAPRRTAQEKVRAEMTKCEVAQAGITKSIELLELSISDYLERKTDGPYFATRYPSLSTEIRKKLIGIRMCMLRYGQHISAFKSDIPNQPNITFLEETPDIKPTPDELSREKLIQEELLEPLQELGVVSKPQPPFLQRIADIEKAAREECVKLYQGKNAAVLPEFMEKYIKSMKENAESFRVNLIKELRSTAEQLNQLSSNISQAVFNSIDRADEFIFDQELEGIEARCMIANEGAKIDRDSNKKALRPNLNNPSCKQELIGLDSKEQERSLNIKEIIQSSLSNFRQSAKLLSQQFTQKLLNNTQALLTIYDNLFIKEDFIQLPGDEVEEKKRTNIKRLARKKLTGKLSEGAGVRGYITELPGLDLNLIKFPEEPEGTTTPKIRSYKNIGQRELIKCRNEMFESYSLLFSTKVYEYDRIFKELLEDELKWSINWQTSVSGLRSKHI